MSPPRLLFVVNSAWFFRSHRLAVATAAREEGYEVHLAAPGEGDAPGDETLGEVVAELEGHGLLFHPVPVYRRWLHPLHDARTLLILRRLYGRLEPRVVHHLTYKPLALGGLAARLAGVTAVVNAVPGLGHIFTLTGLRGRLQQAVMKTGFRVSFAHPNQTAIFENREDRDAFVAEELVPEAETVVSVGSGVDTERFAPGPEPRGTPVVTLASRMLWTKGVGEFVEAARISAREGLEARFVLVGEPDPGNLRSVPEEQLRRWDEEGTVEWWGYRADMPAVYADTHVFCLPSRYGEGLPKVLMEAAASGRPIVASDIPGCRELVRDGENGILVSPRDPEALARAVGRLVADPSLRRRMGKRAREIVREGFTEDRVVEEHLRIYRRLLERAGISPPG